MEKINFIPISKERTLAILEIGEEMIKYRNLGQNYDTKLIHEDYYVIQDSMIHILNVSGDSKVHFPSEWLDPINGMIKILKENQIIK